MARVEDILSIDADLALGALVLTVFVLGLNLGVRFLAGKGNR